MTNRNSAYAIGAGAAASGFTLALLARRRSRGARDVTEYRARTARSVTVRRDAATLYGMWSAPDTLAQFFRGVTSVDVVDDEHQRWTMDLGKRNRHLDVTIVDATAPDRIEWRTPRIGSYAASASVTFHDAGVRGTEVRLSIALDGPTAKTAAAFARLFGAAPPQIAAESLRAFKALAETGEIPKAVRN